MSSKPAQRHHDEAVLPRIRDLQASGLSYRQIADQLDADGFPPPRRGGRWSHVAVKRIIERTAKPNAAPAPTSLSVNGPVNMTGQFTITTAGPVTAAGPVTITTREEAEPSSSEPQKSSPLLLVGLPHSATFLRAGAPSGGGNITLAAADLLFPNPLSFRRRV